MQIAWFYHIFPYYLMNDTLFGGKINIKYVIFSLQILVWNIYHFKQKLTKILSQMSIGLHVKYPLFLPDFNQTLIFSKNPHIQNLTKIHPVAAELFHADGCTNRHTTMLTVARSNFGTAPKRVPSRKVFPLHVIMENDPLYTNDLFGTTQNSSRRKNHFQIYCKEPFSVPSTDA
jgi:hypothetical protein